jgi:hypothetical protein
MTDNWAAMNQLVSGLGTVQGVNLPVNRLPVQYGEPAKVEYIGPESVRAALECAYCGKVIVVDLMRWNGECYRCTGSATIDEIATALALVPPAPSFAEQFVVNSGTMGYRSTDPIVIDQFLGGSGSFPDWRFLDVMSR